MNQQTRRENVTGLVRSPAAVVPPAIDRLLMLLRQTIVAPLRATHPSLIPSRPRLHPYRQFHASSPNFSGTMSEFYNLKAQLPGDKEYDFDQLRGKVVLVVNVASKW